MKDKKDFQLSDEARAKIDMEFSDDGGSFRRSAPPVERPAKKRVRQEPPQQNAQQVPTQSNMGYGVPQQRYRSEQRTPYREIPPPPPPYPWEPRTSREPQGQPVPQTQQPKKKRKKRVWNPRAPKPPVDPEVIQERKEKRKLRKRWRWFIRATVFFVIVIAIDAALLIFSGKLTFNVPRKRDYPIRGPVVTEDMGTVNWKKFVQQNMQMAYIRCTKGTVFEDKFFDKNKSGSAKTSLPTGFLHRFDLGTDGKEQAKHFIEKAGDMDGRLIPCVDISRSFGEALIPVNYDKATSRLEDFIDCIKEEYGCTVVIKCDKKTYKKIASRAAFEDCYIWYVSEFSKPDESINWTIWTYSDRVKFNFYSSKGFLEMAVYAGKENDFENMYISSYYGDEEYY